MFHLAQNYDIGYRRKHHRYEYSQNRGGEGKSKPIAELLKFRGNDVSSISKQKIRCAEIISKTGSKIGGKDIDQWILIILFQIIVLQLIF